MYMWFKYHNISVKPNALHESFAQLSEMFRMHSVHDGNTDFVKFPHAKL